MQSMQLCISSCMQFKDTFDNTQWRKAKQMQSMQLCILSGCKFERTFENTYSGENLNKCNRCDFDSSWTNSLIKHMQKCLWLNITRSANYGIIIEYKKQRILLKKFRWSLQKNLTNLSITPSFTIIIIIINMTITNE